MEITHHTRSVSYDLQIECIKLAVSEAPAMVVRKFDQESPLLPLAQAEVAILLKDAFDVAGSGTPHEVDGVSCELKSGVIAAIEMNSEGPELAGFLQYKPRMLAEGAAVIGYAAVAKKHRGKGVFKQMLNELSKPYPALGLDCSLELVPMYEHLGFVAREANGAHVWMNNLSAEEPILPGTSWMNGPDFLEENPLYINAKELIKRRLGPATEAAYKKLESDTSKCHQEVQAFLRARAGA